MKIVKPEDTQPEPRYWMEQVVRMNPTDAKRYLIFDRQNQGQHVGSIQQNQEDWTGTLQNAHTGEAETQNTGSPEEYLARINA